MNTFKTPHKLLALLVAGVVAATFGPGAVAQNCPQPEATETLDINNVSTLIHTGQRQWTDNETFNAAYEVPAGEGAHATYAGNLWLGGITPDQQLRLAGGTYYSEGETDYFSGPLSTDGTLQASSCEDYDQIWKLYRLHSLKHVEYFDCLNDPNCTAEELFPNGYVTPEIFYTYPAHGNVALNEDFYLAPFYDYNQDGSYNPDDGDCPLFEGMTEVSECDDCDKLKGDCCLFWIDNDAGSVHTATLGAVVGVEIHNMAYAYASSDVLNNQTFYSKRIINRGTNTMSDFYVAVWNDVDLGYHSDDFIQCDANRSVGFGFNGPQNDPEYGLNPPVSGIQLLQGPKMDDDGVDNDDDGVVDNEHLPMTNFMYYNNTSGPNGEPQVSGDYYNLMRSFLINGQPLTCEFEGDPANFIFPGNSVPEDDECYGVTEPSVGNPPGDRRFILSSGPFTFQPGDEQCITYAAVWARNDTIDNDEEQIEHFLLSCDTIRGHYDNCFGCIPPSAAFTQTQSGDNTYDFFPSSSFGDTYMWDFGDGTTSNEVCPTHAFPDEGTYNVCLTVTNECGTTGSCISVDSITDVNDVVAEPYALTFSESTGFVLQGPNAANLRLMMYDNSGRLVQQSTVSSPGMTSVNRVSNGIYIVVVENAQGEHLITEKIAIQGL